MATGRGALAHAGRGGHVPLEYPLLPGVGRGIRPALPPMHTTDPLLLGSGICIPPNSPMYRYLGRGRFLLGQLLYMTPQCPPPVPRSLEDRDPSFEDAPEHPRRVRASDTFTNPHPASALCVVHGPKPLEAIAASSFSVRQMIGLELECMRVAPHLPPPQTRPVNIVHPLKYPTP